MNYIIKRSESGKIERGHWLLVYGRRKTGKTFLLRNLCKFDNYFLIKKNGDILSEGKSFTLEEFREKIKKDLNENKKVVVDEFQRLEEGLLEEITTAHPQGKLVLSGSSLRVIKKFFEPNSPLLGFFTPEKISFIKPGDIIRELKKHLSPPRTIEIAAFLREPWLIPLYNQEKIPEFTYQAAVKSKYIIPALVGEIFTEEERELTKKYEAVLSLVGSGTWNMKDLSSILYVRGIIPEPSQTHLAQYMKNLEEMELIEKIRLYKSKNNYYRLFSPIANIFYYLDSRYDINNRDVSFSEVSPTLQKLINLEVQNFAADLLADLSGGRKEYFVSPDKEIDFIITKRNKPEIIGEVKWKKIEKKDLDRFRNNSRFLGGRKILICREGHIKDREIEVITSKELVERAGKGNF